MKYHNKPIELSEAKRAIYLDFEGRGAKPWEDAPPPVLGGIRVDQVYESYVVDGNLRDLAIDKCYGFFDDLRGFLSYVMNKAEEEDRRIVYWSSRERSLFQDHCFNIEKIGFDLIRPARRKYPDTFKDFRDAEKQFNSKGLSKTARRLLRPRAFGLLSLVAESQGLPRPHSYGAGLVGQWILYVQNQAINKDNYTGWSKGGKTKASRLRNHNEHDCLAMEYVLCRLLDGSCESLRTARYRR